MSATLRVRGETLAGIGFFSGLGPDERQAVVPLLRARHYAAGQLVLSHGEASRDVYFVVSGRVRVTHYAPNGKETTLSLLEAGECFGDLAALDGGTRSADVVAHEDVLLLAMSDTDFLSLVERCQPVAAALLNKLVGLVRGLSERVVEFSTLGVNCRIDAELLRLALRTGRRVAGEIHVDAPPTHAEIASRVSTHREAVTREINRLKRLGLVRCTRSRWTVRDVDALRREATGAAGEPPARSVPSRAGDAPAVRQPATRSGQAADTA